MNATTATASLPPKWTVLTPFAVLVLALPPLMAQAGLFRDGFETTIVAASCAAAAVQAALDDAPPGALVRIPAGDCDWGAQRVQHHGSVRLQGAGAESTVIRRTAAITQGFDYLIEIFCDGGRVDVSQLRLVGNDDLQDDKQRLEDQDNGLALRGACPDFRIHDSVFEKFSNAGLTLRGRPQRGVVYRNHFLSNFKCQPEPVDCLGYGVTVYGDGTQPPLALGTADAVFIEDNYLYDNRHGVASNYGSVYVTRFNTFVSTQRSRNFSMIDAHGWQSGSSGGSRSWEIYGNVLRSEPLTMVVTGIGLRGGDGVVFGNDLGRIPNQVYLRNETCSGTYPLPYQIRSAHIWDNQWSPIPGYPQEPVQITPNCAPYLVEGRDWFRSPRPDYSPYIYPHPRRHDAP